MEKGGDAGRQPPPVIVEVANRNTERSQRGEESAFNERWRGSVKTAHRRCPVNLKDQSPPSYEDNLNLLYAPTPVQLVGLCFLHCGSVPENFQLLLNWSSTQCPTLIQAPFGYLPTNASDVTILKHEYQTNDNVHQNHLL